jgi:hypothetical protein
MNPCAKARWLLLIGFSWRVVLAFPGVFGFFPGVFDDAVGGCPVSGSSMLFLVDDSDEVDSFPVSGGEYEL